MEAVRPEWSEEELPLPEIRQPDTVTEVELAPDKSQDLSIAEGVLATIALEKRHEVDSKVSLTEGELEVRHEKRGSLQAVPISTIIANAKLPPRQPDKAEERNADEERPARPTSNVQVGDEEEVDATQSQVSLYSQAVRTGFMGALIFILIFVLLILLT